MKSYHTIILVGGRSTRFKDFNDTDSMPKSLGYIDKNTLIIYVLKNFIKYEIQNFILPLGFYKNEFIEYFKKIQRIGNIKCNIAYDENDYLYFCNNKKKEINIYLCYTGLYKNKAERVYEVVKKLSINKFIVSYGDAIGNVNLKKVFKYHYDSNCDATGVGMIMRSQYGHYSINEKSVVTQIIEKPVIENMVNIGYFFFKKNSIEYFYKYKKLDLENGVIKKIIKKKRFNVYHHKKFWKSVDTLKDLIELKKFLKKN